MDANKKLTTEWIETDVRKEYIHKQAHKKLHECLDTLVAEWISSPDRPSLRKNTVLELITWSSSQQDCPDHTHSGPPITG